MIAHVSNAAHSVIVEAAVWPSPSLRTFCPRHARAIRELAASARAFEDLAQTFPALLFALATDFGEAEARERARDILLAGGSMRDAAEVMGLPQWLRRLPPQTFQSPLPPLPRCADFAVQIANLLPRNPATAAGWFQDVCLALGAGGETFALWAARHSKLFAGLTREKKFLIAAWSWSSQHPETEAGALIRRPWCPVIGGQRALDEAAAWLQRMALAEWLADGVIRPWIGDGAALGYSFHTLRDWAEFRCASEQLDNCLDQYAHRLRRGEASIVVIRRNSSVIGCLEIGRHDGAPTMPAIVQIRGPRNRRVPAKVWQAAYAWLGASTIEPFTPNRLTAPKGDRQRTRRRLWQPYLDALSVMPGTEGSLSVLRGILAERD